MLPMDMDCVRRIALRYERSLNAGERERGSVFGQVKGERERERKKEREEC
jgi:hypothetical protein